MTLLQDYQQKINAGLIKRDPQQQAIVQLLQDISQKLLTQARAAEQPLGWLTHPIAVSQPVRGLYLWGNVGVGKTFLLDLFYDCLPAEKIKKMRRHFHQFMQEIHQQLKASQGEENPLQQIAQKIAQQAQVLCFDEFMVDDVADAMILSNLFNALFANRICLIASANRAPDHLYENGLQRELFLPAIALIKKYTRVYHLESQQDYRLRHLREAGVYFTPLDAAADAALEKWFEQATSHQSVLTGEITLLGRTIPIRKQAGDTIWFDFLNLCDVPRSPADFLVLAKKYRTVLISGVPVFTANQYNLVTSFIHLIDIFYDARVRVIISAEAAPAALYPEGRLHTIFARTVSRLIEMQSADYFTASR